MKEKRIPEVEVQLDMNVRDSYKEVEKIKTRLLSYGYLDKTTEESAMYESFIFYNERFKQTVHVCIQRPTAITIWISQENVKKEHLFVRLRQMTSLFKANRTTKVSVSIKKEYDLLGTYSQFVKLSARYTPMFLQTDHFHVNDDHVEVFTDHYLAFTKEEHAIAHDSLESIISSLEKDRMIA